MSPNITPFSSAHSSDVFKSESSAKQWGMSVEGSVPLVTVLSDRCTSTEPLAKHLFDPNTLHLYVDHFNFKFG